MSTLTTSACWKELQQHQQSLSNFSIVDAFKQDANRASTMSCQAPGVLLDYSKQLMNDQCFASLIGLAKQQNLTQAIERMRNGDIINLSENRQALHYLLRTKNKQNIPSALTSQLNQVLDVKSRLVNLAEAIQQGQRTGYTNKPFTDIVNIGIGGSDLGPAMIYQALEPYRAEQIQCHYIANISANDIHECLQKLDPETTLFIVSSKSFTTTETLMNAETARAWLTEKMGCEALAQHVIAVTSNTEKAQNWGVSSADIYPLWDWVGGRYSVWSAIGLSLIIGLKKNIFQQLLDGASAMDEHFFNTKLEDNLPVILALLGIWYGNFWHRKTHAVIPYDHRLRRFTAYLQQLEMESNGKNISNQKERLDYTSCPDLWGEAGTNAQHSFFQRFHQGTSFTPIDLIAVIKSPYEPKQHQDTLFTSCLAQSRSLMLGKPSSDLIYDQTPGNRPSSTLIMDALTPQSLGSLIVAYEHKVYVQSVIWDINAFDQWGVELGKHIGKDVFAAINNAEKFKQLDASTQSLLQRFIDSK